MLVDPFPIYMDNEALKFTHGATLCHIVRMVVKKLLSYYSYPSICVLQLAGRRCAAEYQERQQN
ncbi:MAG: hypothetical protein WBF33_06610 [Candidatus Nitrosopolaris sp.]|jgi:hypothetical protein